MRLLVTVAAVALGSPHGCCTHHVGPRPNTRTRDNQLVSKPITIAELAPATGSVVVRSPDGLMRVPLDGSPGTVIDSIPGVMTTDGSIRIHMSRGRYVVRSDGGERVVPDLVATTIGFLMAPDDRHVATATEIVPTSPVTATEVQLAIISLADGTARTFPLAMDHFWDHRWADDGSAFFHHDRVADLWSRVDLATGAITEARPPIRTPDPDGSVDCPAKGFRLRVDIRGDRQRIVLDPIATQANPELLSGLRPRLLVEAENLPHSKLRDDPTRFDHLTLTRGCDHFLFDFAGWVHLGEVETGRYARLVRGSDPR